MLGLDPNQTACLLTFGPLAVTMTATAAVAFVRQYRAHGRATR